MSLQDARGLIRRDEHESSEWGQRVRDTFHMADVFIRVDRPEYIDRCLDLFFCNPFDTPSIDEHAMFFAHGAALRSSDLSRQVGAAIVSPDREILAVGVNEVPRFGGGQYWRDGGSLRDFELGYDPNTTIRREMAGKMIRRIQKLDKHRTPETSEFFRAIKDDLADAKDFDVTEFGRVVHAEMEAIISCARKGLSTKGASLYCTTFPCHVCAKHIVAAGIREVIFIEPYPKSRAQDLYPDSIGFALEPDRRDQSKVVFRPFLGVSPLRYVDLFSLKMPSGADIKRKDDRGRKLDWVNTGEPRIKLSSSTFMEREALFLSEFEL